MILTTTPSIEGKRAVKYLGLVGGDAILGANIFRDFFASIRDIVGGRSASYEAELRKAKDIAITWVITIPGSALVAIQTFALVNLFLGKA